jgi:hypothetical protein
MLQRTVSSVSSMNRDRGGGTAPTESNLNTGRLPTGERVLNNNNNNRDPDAVSDTSSAREREFDALLGPEPDYAFTQRRPMPSRKHRLHEIGVAAVHAREERLKLERDRALMKEMAQLTQRPNITKHARERVAKRDLFYDHAQEWLKRKNSTRERLALEQTERDMAEVFGSPAISQKSREITEDPNKVYIHPVDDWEWRFGEHLDKKRRVAVEPEHIPHVSRSSARVRSNNNDGSFGSTSEYSASGSIEAGNRLYEETHARKERREALLKELVDRELTDPVTGKRYFTPYISDTAKSLGVHRDPTAAGEDLHRQAMEYQTRRDDLHKKLASAESGCTFKPAINPMSESVAESRKPLFDPTWRQDRHVPKDEKKEKKKHDFPSFIRRNHDGWKQTKENRLKDIRETMKRDAMEECTFQPRISKRSQELFLSQNSSGLPASYRQSPPRMTPAAQLDPIFNQSGNSFSSVGRKNNNNNNNNSSSNRSYNNNNNSSRNKNNNNNEYAAADNGENDDSSPPQLPSTTDVLNRVFQKQNYSNIGGNQQQGEQSETEQEFNQVADNALRAAGLRGGGNNQDNESSTTRSSRPSNFVPANGRNLQQQQQSSSSAYSSNTSPSSSHNNNNNNNRGGVRSNTSSSTSPSGSHYTNVTGTTATTSQNRFQQQQQQQQPRTSLPPSVASQMRSSMGGNTAPSVHSSNRHNNNEYDNNEELPPDSSEYSSSHRNQQNQNQNQQPLLLRSNVPTSHSTTTATSATSPSTSHYSSSHNNNNAAAIQNQQQSNSGRGTPNQYRGSNHPSSSEQTYPTSYPTSSGMTPSQQQGQQVGALQNQMYAMLNEWQQLESDV